MRNDFLPCLALISVFLMARLGFICYQLVNTTSYCSTGIPTHVSQQSCTRLGPLKDAPPSEQQHHGLIIDFLSRQPTSDERREHREAEAEPVHGEQRGGHHVIRVRANGTLLLRKDG